MVTNYDYDALNRVISKSYQYDPTGTPPVTYSYDSTTNGKGRLASVSSSVSFYSYSGYDAMGRVKGGTQTIGGQAYTMSYEYDLAGHVKMMKYPSDRTVNYAYDDAGRPSSFSGKLGYDVNHPDTTYSTGITYSPLGVMTKEQFGTDIPIYNKQYHNARGELAEIRVTTSDNGIGDTSWDRGKFINWYSQSLQCGGPTCNAAADNNGNLAKQETLIPNAASWSQLYDYDSLNRLERVKEYNAANTQLWQQEYVYDRWGNRTVHQTHTWGPATGPMIPKPNFGVDPNTNRLTVAAGFTMSYDNGGNVTNDTYTGPGQRSYDGENRMKQAWANGQWQTYSYDGDGRRVKRDVNGIETWQVYGLGGELLAEYAQNGAPSSPQKEYGYRSGQLLITAAAGSSSQSPPQTFQASTDFSRTQGYRNWHYLDSNGTPLTFLTQWGGVWNLPNTSVYLGAYWSHPGDATDAVRQWWAPGAGSFHITGTAFDTDPGGGDGVIVSIKKGAQVLWERTIENGNGAGFSYDLTITVSSGDQISFVTNRRSNSYWDSTSFDPAITFTPGGSVTTYQASTDFSGTQGYRNWHYLDSNGTPLTFLTQWGGVWNLPNTSVYLGGGWSHPGDATDAVRQWRAPGAGSIHITGTAFDTDPGGGDGVIVSIKKGTQVLWERTIENGNGAGFSYDLTTTVSSGEQISFVTNRRSNTYWDSTSFDPTITFTSGGGGTTAEINWMVTDQLGTPRMIIDKTGALANVKRHDYLPFGEELFAGQGGRTPGLGYTGDAVRQKFTAKERDNETGLDYFINRYYSSTQGRFTSVDPLMASARTTNPQTFNRYTYTLNNPLRYVDPNGLADQDPADYKPEFRPCTVGVEAGCSETNTVLAGVTINISEGVPIPLETTNLSIAENMTLGTGQVASDTVIGAGKFGYNTVFGTANMINAPIDYGLSFFTGFQFGQNELYQASTAGEQGAMYGMMIGGILAGGVGSAGATEGALSADVANTFANGYRARTLQMDVTAYRYSGGESGAFGRFLTTRQTMGRIGSPTEAQSFLNLPAGNTAQTLNTFTIPRGTTIFTGRVAGGGASATQIFIRDPSALIPR